MKKFIKPIIKSTIQYLTLSMFCIFAHVHHPFFGALLMTIGLELTDYLSNYYLYGKN